MLLGAIVVRRSFGNGGGGCLFDWTGRLDGFGGDAREEKDEEEAEEDAEAEAERSGGEYGGEDK